MPGSCNHREKIEAKCVLSSCTLYAYIQHIKSDIPREVLHTLHNCIQLRGGEELSLLVYLLPWCLGLCRKRQSFVIQPPRGLFVRGHRTLEELTVVGRLRFSVLKPVVLNLLKMMCFGKFDRGKVIIYRPCKSVIHSICLCYTKWGHIAL